VIRSQLQVPEPWSGELEHALILFLSSNPSISTAEIYPRWAWPDEEIADFFGRRFDGGRRRWIKDGKKSLRADGSYGRATAFWAAVRKRAIELLQREVRPGVDYALTKIVHCKSKSEIGVAEAKKRCVPRYLRRVLTSAAARVIVVLGKPARQAVQEEFGIPYGALAYGPKGCAAGNECWPSCRIRITAARAPLLPVCRPISWWFCARFCGGSAA
jgi:hypothetical protein